MKLILNEYLVPNLFAFIYNPFSLELINRQLFQNSNKHSNLHLMGVKYFYNFAFSRLGSSFAIYFFKSQKKVTFDFDAKAQIHIAAYYIGNNHSPVANGMCRASFWRTPSGARWTKPLRTSSDCFTEARRALIAANGM